MYGTTIDLTLKLGTGKVQSQQTIKNLKNARVNAPILYGVDVFDGSLDSCALNPLNNPASQMLSTYKAQGFDKVLASVSAGVNPGDKCPITTPPETIAQKIKDCFQCGEGGMDGIVFDFEAGCKITAESTRSIVKEVKKACPNYLLTVQDFNPIDLVTYYDDLKDVKGFFGMVIMYDLGQEPISYADEMVRRFRQIMQSDPTKQLPFTLSLPIDPNIHGLPATAGHGLPATKAWATEFSRQKVVDNAKWMGNNYYSFNPGIEGNPTAAAELAKAIAIAVSQ